MVHANKKNNSATVVVYKQLICEAIPVAFVQALGVGDWSGEAEGGDVGCNEEKEGKGEGGEEV